MAYNTRSIKKDVDGRPVPQYFNSTADDYEPLLGENGAARSVLYGPNGQPINSSNPLPTKDDALAALLGELNNAPVTDPSATSATVLQLLRGLLAVAGRETTLAAVKAAIDELTARAATEETLSATRDALDSLAQRGLATEVTLAQAAQALATLAGTVDAGAQQVTLSGQRALLRMDIYDTPIDVSPDGGTTTVTVQPPAGEIWSVRDLLIRIPAVSGATSGSHVLVFRYGGTSSQYNRMFITSPYDTAIEVQGVSVLHGSVDEPLTDRRDQMQYIRGLELSQSVPLVLLYQNLTNAQQSATMTLRVTRRIEYVIS